MLSDKLQFQADFALLADFDRQSDRALVTNTEAKALTILTDTKKTKEKKVVFRVQDELLHDKRLHICTGLLRPVLCQGVYLGICIVGRLCIHRFR